MNGEPSPRDDAQVRAVARAYRTDDDAQAYVAHRRRNPLRRLSKAFETRRIEMAVARARRGHAGRLLDAACGSGRLACDVACDLAPGMARLARRAGKAVVIADCLALPFSDDAFAATVCVRLIHHFDAERRIAALRELGRVARRAVVTYFGDRGWVAYRRRARSSDGTRRALSRQAFRAECACAGLRVVEDFAVLPGFSEQRVATLERS